MIILARELARQARLESFIRARAALLAAAPEGSSGELRYATDRADLDRLLAAVEPRVVLKVTGLRLQAFVDESFETRGRGGWRPLAMSTLALRKRGGDKPLQATGDYKRSFSGQEDGRPFYSRPPPETDHQTYVEVGTNKKTASGIPLGPIHEYGTRPYVINVRNAKVLAAKIGTGKGGAGEHGPLGFLSSTGRGGRVGYWMFFGKTVNHPGIPPRPVLPTAQHAETVLKPVLEGMLQRAIDGRD